MFFPNKNQISFSLYNSLNWHCQSSFPKSQSGWKRQSFIFISWFTLLDLSHCDKFISRALPTLKILKCFIMKYKICLQDHIQIPNDWMQSLLDIRNSTLYPLLVNSIYFIFLTLFLWWFYFYDFMTAFKMVSYLYSFLIFSQFFTE